MFKGARARGGGLIPTDASVSVLKLARDLLAAIAGTPDLTVLGNEESTLEIVCQLNDVSGNPLNEKTLLRAWLSDSPAGSVTSASDFSASWNPGALETIVTNKDWDVLTDGTGTAIVTVEKSGDALTLYLNVAIEGRISSVEFTVGSTMPSVGQYDLFEITPTVVTDSVYPYWPYDEDPNEGVPPGVGVSVDGLFSNDNWETTIVQPGFYFQDYTYQSRSEDGGLTFYDWLYPSGNPGWKIRFAPTTVGTWKYKVRVKDAAHPSGVLSDEASFYCRASSNHGFIKLTPTDCRYFETSDGTYINFVGISCCSGSLRDKEALYASYGSNGINLVRPWWQGSQGPVLFGLSGQGGMHEWGGDNFGLSYAEARAGEILSGKITGNGNGSTETDVEPSTVYKYSAWVKTVGLTGPLGSGDYGVYLKVDPCVEGEEPLTEKLHGDTPWTEISGTFTTVNVFDMYKVNWVKVVVDNTTAGVAYFTDLSLRKDLGGGEYGPELIHTPHFNQQKYVSQREAWKADYEVEAAKRNGVYLKVVLQEMLDVIFRSIQPDGTGGPFSDENIYASDTHACRTYQEYFWRYIIARYGYATNIHSFEFCNEGNPFSNTHNAAAEALASYFNDHDPNRHLCTTSNYGSYFPTTELWSQVPSAAYTDRHQYIGKVVRERLQYVYGWLETADGIEYIEDCLDDTIYRSAPYSLHLTNSTPGREVFMTSRPIPVKPGHTYTFSWYIKGLNVTKSDEVDLDWQFPTMLLRFVTGWLCCNTGSFYQPWEPEKLIGTWNWTQRSFEVTAPEDAHYVLLFPSIHWCLGEVWFDDITLYDETDQVVVKVPNGKFDEPNGMRMDYDTALIDYSVGTELGYRDRRQIAKPLIRGELGISGEKLADSITFGGHVYGWTGENQELVYDADGIWFKKLVWAQINPFGVIDMYWWTDSINFKGLHKYAKAYQRFMSGIPLSNGHYQDIAATVSGSDLLRVLGQKDLTNNWAHLWVDNKSHTWKNVVDRVPRTRASGQISITGLEDGGYEVEVWDPATGEVTGYLHPGCSGGILTLQVTELLTDIAYRIKVVPP
jgi:hypothetical protein